MVNIYISIYVATACAIRTKIDGERKTDRKIERQDYHRGYPLLKSTCRRERRL